MLNVGFIHEFAHQFFLVDQQQHENQHEGQYCAIHHLRKYSDLDQRKTGYQDHSAPATMSAV